MGDKTGISWTDATWNPVRGCSRVSAGCVNCYAEVQAARIVRMGKGKPSAYDGLVKLVGKDKQPHWTGDVRLVREQLALPLRWSKPRRIFVNSMSDLFHEKLTNEDIACVFGIMAAAGWHTFQVLTKRAKRMREWFEWIKEMREVDGDPWVTCLRETVTVAAGDESFDRFKRGNLDLHAHFDVPHAWPLPNVWLGVSVEHQAAADERIPELLSTPAAARFLSCEPLIAPVDLKGWGNHAPDASNTDAAPETWDRFAWPEWVPEEQRKQIEEFWNPSWGRGPRAWLRDHAIQRVPATGAYVTCKVDKSGWATINKMATAGVSGRYLHSWNNIGRIITDDGQTIYASGGSGSGWLSKWLDNDGEYRSKLHWVIAGCESGPGARECGVEWLRTLRDQCTSAGVAFFLKQAVELRGSDDESDDTHRIAMHRGSKRKHGGVIELPALDGEQHAAFPEVARG